MEQINLHFAWIWMLGGMISGAVIGLFFHDPQWLGGFGSWRRRMLRLGHIAFLGTGLLNLGFALSVPHLRAAGHGRVVNIASASGKRVRNGFAPGYAMTKHAVVALTHATRQHGWDDGIRAVAVCPGFIDTEMIADVDTGREPVIDPADIAELVTTWLSLPDSASVAELIVTCRLEDAL